MGDIYLELLKEELSLVVDILETNVAREFVGKAYIKYEMGGTVGYRFAEDNDNIRSMAYVAQRAIADKNNNLTDEKRERLQELYVDYTVEYYKETEDSEYTLSETETYTAKLDETVMVEEKTYERFALSEEKSCKTGKALANDKLVLRIYYDYKSTMNLT